MDTTKGFVVCATHGAIVHVMSNKYKPARQTLGRQAQIMIKKVTAHNAKLGFNWDIKTVKYTLAPDG